jgi:hypothetical protein
MQSRDYSRISKNPDTLFKAIPQNLQENLKFRMDLHSYLVGDEKAKIDFYAKAFIDPRIFFNACLWVPSPKQGSISPKVPFILYPHQERAVTKFKDAIETGYDVLADKSRDEGATFLVCGMGLLYWLIEPMFQMLLGSRVEDLVDRATGIKNGFVVGFERCLFYKLLFMLNELPLYAKPEFDKSHMILQNLENGACFQGETTNAGFGKGARGRVIMVDEAAQIEPKLAQKIFENIADTSSCVILNSTQGDWGEAHPYAKALRQDTTQKVILDWTENPRKNKGLYESPKSGIVRILDLAYYKRLFPQRFNHLREGEDVEVQAVAGTYPFVADGGVSNFHCKRSPWFDNYCERPNVTPRSVAQNVLRVPAGSTDMFFRYDLLENLREQVKAPNYEGKIDYELENGMVDWAKFVPGGANSNFSWWGQLPNKRPDQSHNYVVGCDISRGTGASNSVAAVVDVNESKLVGLLVTPYHRQEQFAELVVALCEWIGGVERPLLNWETNGASDFAARIDELGYYHLWDDGKKGHGWRSSGGPQGSKIELLNSYESALFEGQKETTEFDCLYIYDEQLVNEMAQYVFFEGRVDVGPATMQTESSGAKAAHGDRVIGVAIATLTAKQQTIGRRDQYTLVEEGSFFDRKQRRDRADAKRKRQSKEWYI